MKIDLPILSSQDCQACRKCCKFDPDEIQDAPTFTEQQRERLSREFAQENLRFEQRGKLWNLLLDKIDGRGKYICPLFDSENTLCRAYDYDIFDCRTWPFYIMRKDGKVVIALSPDCPVVAGKDSATVLRYAQEVIGPKMVEAARREPDLITDHHGNAIVFYEVNDF